MAFAGAAGLSLGGSLLAIARSNATFAYDSRSAGVARLGSEKQ